MKINIEKSKLSKAMKQISIFVGKNNINKSASLIHFKNENNKTIIFATDFASAGKACFDTEETEKFEFCLEYSQLSQVLKIRNKIITAELFDTEQGKGIEFYDDKTKFTWATLNSDELIEIEKKTTIPNIPYFEINAKLFKNALREAGYARNEKETQTIYITGVNFSIDGKNISMSSTDRHRIAAWKSVQEVIEGLEANSMNGVLSPKTVQSVGLFDDDENIKIYIDDTKIVLVSETLEAYATKIQCTFPDISKFFEKEILSSYEINTADVLESLSIIDGVNTKSLNLEFSEEQIKLTARNENGDTVTDYFACNRLDGNNEEICLDSVMFMDIFKNVKNDKIKIEFRDMGNNFRIISYSSEDGAYGMLAPQRKY